MLILLSVSQVAVLCVDLPSYYDLLRVSWPYFSCLCWWIHSWQKLSHKSTSSKFKMVYGAILQPCLQKIQGCILVITSLTKGRGWVPKHVTNFPYFYCWCSRLFLFIQINSPEWTVLIYNAWPLGLCFNHRAEGHCWNWLVHNSNNIQSKRVLTLVPVMTIIKFLVVIPVHDRGYKSWELWSKALVSELGLTNVRASESCERRCEPYEPSESCEPRKPW